MSVSLPQLPHPRRTDVDGADELARPLRYGEVRWGITAKELRRRKFLAAGTDRENERMCEECHHRVTIRPDGTEVGHARGRKNPKCSQHCGFNGGNWYEVSARE